MYIYVYVCMYVYSMYVSMYVREYVCMYVHTSMCMYNILSTWAVQIVGCDMIMSVYVQYANCRM